MEKDIEVYPYSKIPRSKKIKLSTTSHESIYNSPKYNVEGEKPGAKECVCMTVSGRTIGGSDLNGKSRDGGRSWRASGGGVAGGGACGVTMVPITFYFSIKVPVTRCIQFENSSSCTLCVFLFVQYV